MMNGSSLHLHLGSPGTSHSRFLPVPLGSGGPLWLVAVGCTLDADPCHSLGLRVLQMDLGRSFPPRREEKPGPTLGFAGQGVWERNSSDLPKDILAVSRAAGRDKAISGEKVLGQPKMGFGTQDNSFSFCDFNFCTI